MTTQQIQTDQRESDAFPVEPSMPAVNHLQVTRIEKIAPAMAEILKLMTEKEQLRTEREKDRLAKEEELKEESRNLQTALRRSTFGDVMGRVSATGGDMLLPAMA